ncbi:MAG: radical SAM protein [Rhodospirillales bacterium]
MNGRRDLKDVVCCLTDALGSQAGALTSHLATRLAPLLVDNSQRTLATPAESTASPLSAPIDGLRRLPGPRILHWWVTRFCPRRCRYCYGPTITGGRAADSTLNRAELRSIITEAAALGARTLLLTGGEPLLRRDLPEIIGDAIAAGVTPLLTTKMPISCSLAQRLGKAGIAHMALSLDSVDPQASRNLIGSAAYPNQVRRSASNLTATGVAFSIQAVVPISAAPPLDDLAEFAHDIGARSLLLMEQEATPVTPNDSGQAADTAWPERRLDALRDVLAMRFPKLKVDVFYPRSIPSDAADGVRCDIGFTRMFFLPDGTVHRCYKLIDDVGLAGKNLRTTSVAAAWHDGTFARLLVPPADDYADTVCGQCSDFETCQSQGRCIAEAAMRHGRYAERDRNCRWADA